MDLTKVFSRFRTNMTKRPVANGQIDSLFGNPLLGVLFDPDWYLEQYCDAAEVLEKQEHMTALTHYLTLGIDDDRAASPFFDAKWYLAANPDLPRADKQRENADALIHYVTTGCREGRSPNPIFDERWYASRYCDKIRSSGKYLNAYHHFLTEGAATGFSPSPLFDELWYRRTYADVAAAIREGLLSSAYHDYMHRRRQSERRPCPYFEPAWYTYHYPVNTSPYEFAYWRFLVFGAVRGDNPSPYFDENWYRTTHQIDLGTYVSGYHHFLYEGARADCAPNPYFQPKWYLNWYPQVRLELATGRFAHAFEHYVCEGCAHGLSPNPYFEEAWYLQTNPDVAQAVLAGSLPSGHLHYLSDGSRENRRPSTVFDAQWYRANYPDVDDYIENGLANDSYDHFFRYGRLVDRSASPDFDELWYRRSHPDVGQEIREGKWLDSLHHFLEKGILLGYAPKTAGRPDQREQNVTVTACANLELADFLGNYRRLSCETCAKPLVSIVLVLYNRAELTLRCLRSIVNWADVPYELIIVDNDSRDETFEMLNRVRGAQVIRNGCNLHFLKAANQGAEAATGEYLLFLNNDSEIQVGALGSAARILRGNPEIGAVGAKIIFNNGMLQEAGSYLLKSGFSVQFGRGKVPFESEFMHQRDVPYCSGAFLMTPRRLFLDSGSFDTAFSPAYCEDVDYCLRLWQMGLRVVFNPDSMLLHHETASSSFHRLLWPSVLRNLSILRARYCKQLETAADYSEAPVSSLDGFRARESYIIIVDSIAAIMNHRAVSALVDDMLGRKLFLTIYPAKPWLGERMTLKGHIPDEVEVVGGKGIRDLEEFCIARRDIYVGGVCLSTSPVVLELVRRLGERLPRGCILSVEDDLPLVHFQPMRKGAVSNIGSAGSAHEGVA